MKITMTTALRDRETAFNLTKAFINCYNNNNALVIEKEEAKLEIDLATCSREKAESFFNDIITIFYGEKVTPQERENEPIIPTTEKEEVSSKNENSQKTDNKEADNHEEDEKKNAEATATDIRVVAPEEIKIEGEKYEQVLEKIAQSSSSYGEFLHSVEFNLKLSKSNRDKFWIIMNGTQVFEYPEEVKLSKILKVVESKGKQLSRYEINYLFSQIKARTGYSGSEFVRILLEYREKYGYEPSPIVIRQARIKCLPQNEEFEEALSMIDMSKPIEERVAYIFTIMNFNLKIYRQPVYFREDLITFVSEAVQMKKIDINKALNAVKTVNQLMLRMVLSEQVNGFAKKVAGQPQETIATSTFLKDLQSVILSRTELKNLK